MHQTGEADIGGTCIAPPLGCTVRKRGGVGVGGGWSTAAKLEDRRRGELGVGFLRTYLVQFPHGP